MTSQILSKHNKHIGPITQEKKLVCESPDCPVVGLKDEVKTLLRSNALLKGEMVKSRYMGVHSDNRYWDGVVPANVLGLLGNMFTQGFALSAMLDA